MSNLSSHNIFVRYFDSLNICNKTRYQIKKLNDSRLLEALTALWYKSWCPKQDNWIDPVPQLAANIPGHALRPEAFQDRAQPLIFSLNMAVLLKVLNIILWQCWDRLLDVLWVLDGIFRRRLRTAVLFISSSEIRLHVFCKYLYTNMAAPKYGICYNVTWKSRIGTSSILA